MEVWAFGPHAPKSYRLRSFRPVDDLRIGADGLDAL